jgi:hypothetical protein
MLAKDAFVAAFSLADLTVGMYLDGLDDNALLVRPVPGCNHIAWQIGHLIVADHNLTEGMFPGSMPALPAGFAEKFTKETSKLDSAGAFLPKATLLEEKARQRAAILALLAKLTPEDFDKPGPEMFREMCPTVGSVFDLVAQHWMMHAGQWAVIRRKLGFAPLF